MAQVTDLEEQILSPFRLACQQGRWDVAEHLLQALEALEERPDGSRSQSGKYALTEAYRELARRPQRRRQ
ncbi:MAG: hypothetical protein EOQ57_16620 [Mesorhizobium sp.]|uniref:hypothetical protein n=1 Tax=Mesorhizobium sp. TaxID=1871066 RepID=UPI000FE9A0A7|nr:hypothetical protein [Mesorhizobium sp.]RWC00237.1 MAG: hypothetical protein EOQ57_16620 [Mesorhizobium sp.]